MTLARVRRRTALFGSIAAALLFASMWASAKAEENGVRAFSRGSWAKIRDAHMGHPLIVHFWGLTCGPCRIEMPEWGRLLSQTPGLALVTVHGERAPPDSAMLTEMLAASGLAGAENWAFADSFQEPLRFEIDPHWHGELPRTVLVAGDGTMTTITGPADMAAIRAWLRDGREKHSRVDGNPMERPR